MSLTERTVGALTLLVAEQGVLFTCRSGGVSSGPYRSLNLSERVGDAHEAVMENRRRLQEATRLSGWASAEQVHGSRVIAASECSPSAQADAIIVRPGEGAAAVLTADCVPLAIRDHTMAAVVHAGWRGIVSGIVQRTLERFRDPAEAQAWIGPAIGPCHYQVGQDVAAQIASSSADAGVISERDGSTWADLPGAVRAILRSQGVQVSDANPPCTYCDHRFFSHRRDGTTGRQALLAWM